ncbi:MAG: DEAD/DEAH box helicase [Nitrososphaerota archaeon]
MVDKKGAQLTLDEVFQKRITEFIDNAVDEAIDNEAKSLETNPPANQPADEVINNSVEKANAELTIDTPLIQAEEFLPFLSLTTKTENKNVVYKPYPYQEDAFKQAITAKHGTIVMPTGSGKTIVGAMVAKYAEEETNANVLIVVPQIVILNQWQETFRKAGTTVTTYFGEEKKLSHVTVTTYQSLTRDLSILDPFQIVIFDEVHHLYADEYSSAIPLLRDKLYVIGFTATALDPRDKNYALQEEVLPVVYKLTPVGLAQYGRANIPSWIEYEVSSPSIVDLIGNFRKRYLGILAHYDNNPQDLFRAAQRKAIPALMAMKINNKIKELYSATTDKLVVSAYAVAEELDINPQAKIIIFTETAASANTIFRILTALNIPTLLFLSERGLTAQEKADELEKLKQGYYKVLLGVAMIIEGLDVPEMDVAIFVSSTIKSIRRFTQKIGRILRFREGKNPRILTIVYKFSDEVETIKEQMQTLSKSEPDETVEIPMTKLYDLKNAYSQLLGGELNSDPILMAALEYASKINTLEE